MLAPPLSIVTLPFWPALQLSQPPHAQQYEAALQSAAVASIEPVLREMASGAAPALEVEDFKSGGRVRVMILEANRQRLLRHCPSSQVSGARNCSLCAGAVRLPETCMGRVLAI